MKGAVKRHANARTTFVSRYAIRTAPAAMNNTALARRISVSATTIARWRGRDSILDRSSAPHHHGRRKFSDETVRALVQWHRQVGLPLDAFRLWLAREKGVRISRSRLAAILAAQRPRRPAHGRTRTRR